MPPVPAQYQQQQQRPRQQLQRNAYGARQDDTAGYYEKNASSVALNDDGYKQKSGKPRQLVGQTGQPETYEISALSHGSQGIRSPTTPMSGRQGSTIERGLPVTTNAPQIDMPAFFNEIDDVRQTFRELESQIVYIDQLHSRQLQGQGGDAVSYELEEATARTRQTTSDLRKRIKELQETTRIRTHGHAEQERQVRKAQIESVRVRFLDLVQNYQSMEMKNRDKAKRGIERQYQIVKPDASPEEIRQVVEGGQEVQIFAQAVSHLRCRILQHGLMSCLQLRQSTRVTNARGVLNEVQNRHEEIKRMAQTMMELQQLFNEMAV